MHKTLYPHHDLVRNRTRLVDKEPFFQQLISQACYHTVKYHASIQLASSLAGLASTSSFTCLAGLSVPFFGEFLGLSLFESFLLELGGSTIGDICFGLSALATVLRFTGEGSSSLPRSIFASTRPTARSCFWITAS